jgi:hypothetical protein
MSTHTKLYQGAQEESNRQDKLKNDLNNKNDLKGI